MTKSNGIGRGHGLGSKRAHFTNGKNSNPLARQEQPSAREPLPPKGGTWQEEGIDIWLKAMRWVMEENEECDFTEWQRTARRYHKKDPIKFIKELMHADSQWLTIKAKQAESSQKDDEPEIDKELAVQNVVDWLKAKPLENE
jgi:hypothetical protein